MVLYKFVQHCFIGSLQKYHRWRSVQSNKVVPLYAKVRSPSYCFVTILISDFNVKILCYYFNKINILNGEKIHYLWETAFLINKCDDIHGFLSQHIKCCLVVNELNVLPCNSFTIIFFLEIKKIFGNGERYEHFIVAGEY